MADKKKILLFSTLNPYPFWAGSENLWYNFVCDERVRSQLDFVVCLADSPVTRKKAEVLIRLGVSVKFYKHFNVSFRNRNFYKVWDKARMKKNRTLPWYNEIKRDTYDLVWFNVSVTNDLLGLDYAVELCQQMKIPYSMLLQLSGEQFYLEDENELRSFTNVAQNARRFIFIAARNRLTVEKAMANQLTNTFHTVNAIPEEMICSAIELSKEKNIQTNGRANFFSLARFSPVVKGQSLLLEAFASDEWKSRDWQLSFIGVSGFSKVYLEKIVRYYGLERERIIIKDHTAAVLEEICKQDVLLMPSAAEGTPFAMVESMACGRPAMGTPVGGIPELIVNGKTGWLSKTTHISDISDILEKVWKDREQWRIMGKEAQLFIKDNYNQEKTFIGLLEIFLKDSSR